MMKKDHIEPFFATLKAANPQPNTELEYTSVFELLTAVLVHQYVTGLHQVLGFAAKQANGLNVGLQHRQA